MTMNLLMKCNDIEETKLFYSKTLGFNAVDTAERTCTAEKAGGTIVFSTGDNLGGAPSFTGTVYFFIPNVDEFYKTIKDKVDMQWPLQNMSYGTQEFGIKGLQWILFGVCTRLKTKLL